MTNIPDVVSQADSLLPLFDWDNDRKRVYLSYRLTGFGMREAAKLAGVVEKTIKNWRKADENFNKLDTEGLSEARHGYSSRAIGIEFTRNMRLILQRDFTILTRAVEDETQLTKEERQYLNRIRASYTPNQLEVMQRLLGEIKDNGVEDYDELIMIMRRKHSGQASEEAKGSLNKASVIETEYSESPVLTSRASEWEGQEQDET